MTGPDTPMYEWARARLVAKLRAIGAQDKRNGYAALADRVDRGEAERVDSWIAMELVAEALAERSA